jgi:hypothetical protein
VARHYHVDVARFATGADHKWVDNLLSHFDVPGVEGARQGLARRISVDGVYHIALIRALSRDLGMSVASAVSLAGLLLSERGDARIEVTTGMVLALDRGSFTRRIDLAIAEAVESVAPARRGRPPKRPPDA